MHVHIHCIDLWYGDGGRQLSWQCGSGSEWWNREHRCKPENDDNYDKLHQPSQHWSRLNLQCDSHRYFHSRHIPSSNRNRRPWRDRCNRFLHNLHVGRNNGLCNLHFHFHSYHFGYCKRDRELSRRFLPQLEQWNSKHHRKRSRRRSDSQRQQSNTKPSEHWRNSHCDVHCLQHYHGHRSYSGLGRWHSTRSFARHRSIRHSSLLVNWKCNVADFHDNRYRNQQRWIGIRHDD